MRILLDTNVILRLSDSGHTMHRDTLAAIDWLDANGHECVIVPQVLYEYWVVATRHAENNGLGMAVVNADAAISVHRGSAYVGRTERFCVGFSRSLSKNQALWGEISEFVVISTGSSLKMASLGHRMGKKMILGQTPSLNNIRNRGRSVTAVRAIKSSKSPIEDRP